MGVGPRDGPPDQLMKMDASCGARIALPSTMRAGPYEIGVGSKQQTDWER